MRAQQSGNTGVFNSDGIQLSLSSPMGCKTEHPPRQLTERVMTAIVILVVAGRHERRRPPPPPRRSLHAWIVLSTASHITNWMIIWGSCGGGRLVARVAVAARSWETVPIPSTRRVSREDAADLAWSAVCSPVRFVPADLPPVVQGGRIV